MNIGIFRKIKKVSSRKSLTKMMADDHVNCTVGVETITLINKE